MSRQAWASRLALLGVICTLMVALQGVSALNPPCGVAITRACSAQASSQAPGQRATPTKPSAPTQPSTPTQPAPTAPNTPLPTARPTPGAIVADGFHVFSYTDAQGRSMTYYLFIPAQYDATKSYPLVLILHGGGEGHAPGATPAQDQEVLLEKTYVSVWTSSDPEPYAPNVQQKWPSFILVPQVVAPNRWVNVLANTGSYTMTPQPSDSLLLAKEILDTVQRQYTGIDANRLYVTGVSMGGYGAWEAVERWPDYFAAAVPIAGAGDLQEAAALVSVPIWAFHGAKDVDVPVSGSRAMIQAIIAAGGHPRYTEYSNDQHEAWLDAFGITGAPSTAEAFYTWLFAQARQPLTAPSGSAAPPHS